MFANNIKQDKSGLWIIRPRGETGGLFLNYKVIDFSISGSGDKIVNDASSFIGIPDYCNTGDPIVFPNEKVLNVDLNKYQLTGFFDDVEFSSNLACKWINDNAACSSTFYALYSTCLIRLEFRDQCNNFIQYAYIGGSQVSDVGSPGWPKSNFSLNYFNINGNSAVSPQFLGAIIPSYHWTGGGGTVSLKSKLIFQYISD